MASTKDLAAEVRLAQNVIFKTLSHDVNEQRAESADLLQHRAGIQHPPSKRSLTCPLLISHQNSPSKVFRINLEPASATAAYVSQTCSLRNSAGCLERGRLMMIFLLVQA